MRTGCYCASWWVEALCRLGVVAVRVIQELPVISTAPSALRAGDLPANGAQEWPLAPVGRIPTGMESVRIERARGARKRGRGGEEGRWHPYGAWTSPVGFSPYKPGA